MKIRTALVAAAVGLFGVVAAIPTATAAPTVHPMACVLGIWCTKVQNHWYSTSTLKIQDGDYTCGSSSNRTYLLKKYEVSTQYTKDTDCIYGGSTCHTVIITYNNYVIPPGTWYRIKNANANLLVITYC